MRGFAVLGTLSVFATLNAGCFDILRECGSVKCKTGYVDMQRPVNLDDHEYHEICGDIGGSFGHHFDDGTSILQFSATHDDSGIGQTASMMFLEVFFETSMIKPGKLTDVVGAAYVIDYSGTKVSIAPYSTGTIEILEDEGRNNYGDRKYKMRWDVEFGEPGTSQYWYTANGEDSVHFLE